MIGFSFHPPPLRRVLLPVAAVLVLPLGAQNVEFVQRSVPAGVVAQTTYPLPGTLVATVTAPDTSANYRFAHWTLNGTRWTDDSGVSAANPATFTVSGAVDAVATYVLTAQDSDADGLPDWWELRYFGNLDQVADGDPDADGFTNTYEYANGTHPGQNNERAQGGVSRFRGEVLNVAVGVGNPTWPYGGVSRSRGTVEMVIENSASFAMLREISSPLGVIAQSRVIAKGSTVNLLTPPSPFSGYRFTGWLVDGVRFDVPTQNQPIAITVTADTTAVARYTSEGEDTDGDGLPDWQEWFYYNSLQYELNSDPDGDGYSIAVEQFRGYSTIAPNQLGMGGISRQRGLLTSVDMTGRLPFRLTSDPGSILEQTQFLPAGTVVTVPDKGGSSYANYKFCSWDLDGTRQQDASGVALTGFQFALAAPATATAHYIDPAVDSVGDGITDWTKMTYYGSLTNGAASDTDGDGFSFAQELARDSSPRVVNTLAQGGISRLRSPLTAVNAEFLPNPPAIGVMAATNITQTTARLNATVNPIGAATTVMFEWGTTSAYGHQTPVQDLAGSLLALTTRADISGLRAKTSYHFRVVATNQQGTSTGDDVTFQTPPPEYDAWAAGYGVGGFPEDADHDGLSNLMEFALGTDPTKFTAAPAPQLPSGGVLEYTYNRSRKALIDGVTFTVEWSGTLQPDWSGVGVVETLLKDDGVTQRVNATIPTGDSTRKFVRMRVVHPDAAVESSN